VPPSIHDTLVALLASVMSSVRPPAFRARSIGPRFEELVGDRRDKQQQTDRRFV